jgi:hypothetical protein
MIARSSKAESSSNGIPMQVIACEPFENEMGKGLFTHRSIYLVKYDTFFIFEVNFPVDYRTGPKKSYYVQGAMHFKLKRNHGMLSPT